MKKLIALVLCLAMVLSLAACRNNTTDPSSNNPDETVPSGTQTPGESKTQPDGPTQPEPTEPAGPHIDKILQFRGDLPATLNPLNSNSDSSFFHAQCAARLYRKDWDKTQVGIRAYIPEQAAGEPKMMDTEGKVWNIELLDGLHFTNGTPITAETYIYSIRQATNPKLSFTAMTNINANFEVVGMNDYMNGAGTWEQVGLKALDSKTIELRCSETTALQVMKTFSGNWFAPVDPELFKSCLSADGTTCTYGTTLEKTAYCGPFYPTEYVESNSMSLRKNPDYVLADEVPMDGIDIIKATNAVGIQMFENDQVDFTSVSNAQAVEYEDSPDFFISMYRRVYFIEINYGTDYYTGVNTKDENGNPVGVELTSHHRCDVSGLANPILNNLDFRKALWYAVDRATIGKLVASDPATFFVPKTSYPGADALIPFRNLPEVQAYTPSTEESYNPALAKDYLEKALKATGQEKVEIELLYNSGDSIHETIASYLQEDFNNIFGGKITLKLNAVPNDTRMANMTGFRDNGKTYQLGLGTWARSAGDTSPFDAMIVWANSMYEKSYNAYGNEKFEKLAWESTWNPAVKNDPEVNAKFAMEMEKIVYEDVMSIPVLESYNCYLVKEKVLVPEYMGDDPAQWTIWRLDLDVQ